MVRRIFTLLIGVIFLFVNFFVNYIPLNNTVIITLIILAWIPILLLNNGFRSELKLKKKVLLSVASFVIEALIFLVSSFIFESGLIFNLDKTSLWEYNKLIGLYAITGMFLIEEFIKYLYTKNHILNQST